FPAPSTTILPSALIRVPFLPTQSPAGLNMSVRGDPHPRRKVDSGAPPFAPDGRRRLDPARRAGTGQVAEPNGGPRTVPSGRPRPSAPARIPIAARQEGAEPPPRYRRCGP